MKILCSSGFGLSVEFLQCLEECWHGMHICYIVSLQSTFFFLTTCMFGSKGNVFNRKKTHCMQIKSIILNMIQKNISVITALVLVRRVGQISQVTCVTSPQGGTDVLGHVYYDYFGRDKLPRSRLLQILCAGQTSQVTFITNTSGGTNFPDHACYSSGAGNINQNKDFDDYDNKEYVETEEEEENVGGSDD